MLELPNELTIENFFIFVTLIEESLQPLFNSRTEIIYDAGQGSCLHEKKRPKKLTHT